MRRLVLALLVGFAVVVVVPATAHACSCVGEPVAEQAVGADLVLRGTVEGRDVVGLPLPVLSSGDEVVYDIAVERVYKGASGPRAMVHSVRSGASCGLEVETGGEYVLFADERGGKVHAGLCGGSTPATDEALAAVTDVLGPGAPPDPSLVTADTRPPLLTLAAGGLVVLALGGAAGWLVRRRRQA